MDEDVDTSIRGKLTARLEPRIHERRPLFGPVLVRMLSQLSVPVLATMASSAQALTTQLWTLLNDESKAHQLGATIKSFRTALESQKKAGSAKVAQPAAKKSNNVVVNCSI